MKNDSDVPQDSEKGSEMPSESGQELARKDGAEGPSMSRRDALKKGAYAAPAIMTIGSVPRFAEGAPSTCKDKGRGDEKSSDKNRGQGCGVN